MSDRGKPTRRERDDLGRPRNARPRDALGRPLARGARGVARVPDDLSLTPAETLREAQRLLDEGMPFFAHEVLEAAWKAAEPGERDLWKGLAQIAVGLTHVQRENAKGAVALLRRGAERVAPYAGSAPYGIDAAGAARHAEQLAARVERGGPGEARPGDLRPRLVRGL